MKVRTVRELQLLAKAARNMDDPEDKKLYRAECVYILAHYRFQDIRTYTLRSTEVIANYISSSEFNRIARIDLSYPNLGIYYSFFNKGQINKQQMVLMFSHAYMNTKLARKILILALAQVLILKP